jgi:hypothetical protein
MEIKKEHLEEAFLKGMSYDYRPTFFMCFNRWYNEKFVDVEKCNNCKYTEVKHKTNHKVCKKCIDCSLFETDSKYKK